MPFRGFFVPVSSIPQRALTLLMALLTASLLSSPGHAGIYRWIDQQGRVHFGDRPPSETASENVDIKPDPTPRAPAPDAAERREKRQRLLRAWEEERRQRAEASTKAKERGARQQHRCALARDRLRSYRNSSYLYDLDSEGNRKIMSESDRENAIRKLEEIIERHCR